MILTDKQFYKAAIDLSIPEMKQARDLFFAGEKEAAEHVFATYVRGHIDYKTYFSLPSVKAAFDESCFKEEKKKKIIERGDRICEGWFAPTGYAHQYVNLEMDWETNHTPNNYCEWVWVLSRHEQFTPLAQEYYVRMDEKYVRAFEKII